MAEARPHHVIVEIDQTRFGQRVGAFKQRLAEWWIDAEVGSVLGRRGAIRIRFAAERAALPARP